MSMHYIAVLVPEKGGGWSVIFPDLPGCATHGPTVHDAITTASGVASTWLAATCKSGDPIPAPRSYEDLRRAPRRRSSPFPSSDRNSEVDLTAPP